MYLISLCGLYLLFLPFVSLPLRVQAEQNPPCESDDLHIYPGKFNTWFPVTLTVNPLGSCVLNVPFDGCPLMIFLLIKLAGARLALKQRGTVNRVRRRVSGGKTVKKKSSKNDFVKAEKIMTSVLSLLCVVPTRQGVTWMKKRRKKNNKKNRTARVESWFVLGTVF